MRTLNYCRLIIQDHAEFVCHDDGCHLRKFARNPSLTATASQIANLEIAIDRI